MSDGSRDMARTRSWWKKKMNSRNPIKHPLRGSLNTSLNDRFYSLFTWKCVVTSLILNLLTRGQIVMKIRGYLKFDKAKEKDKLKLGMLFFVDLLVVRGCQDISQSNHMHYMLIDPFLLYTSGLKNGAFSIQLLSLRRGMENRQNKQHNVFAWGKYAYHQVFLNIT